MSTKTNSTQTEAVTFATVEEYRAADAKGKAAIRKVAQTAMAVAIDKLDIKAASAAKAALESYTSEKTSTKVEVDPFTVLAHRIAVLETAAAWLRSGEVSIEGLDVEIGDDFEAKLTEALSNVPEDIEAVVKVATAKQTRSGKQNDVAAAIQSAFEDLDKGAFLTVAEIANKVGDSSWGGRITARLFPKSGTCTVPGVTPQPAKGDRPKGATKA